MGLRTYELTPIGSNGPTSLTPPAKDVYAKAFYISRTDTTATLKAVLPMFSTVIDVDFHGPASNAGTTATVSVGTTSANANEWVNGQDVKTAGGKIRPGTSLSATNLPNIDNIPQTGDIQVFAKYAESGTASSSGGPWVCIIWYIP